MKAIQTDQILPSVIFSVLLWLDMFQIIRKNFQFNSYAIIVFCDWAANVCADWFIRSFFDGSII